MRRRSAVAYYEREAERRVADCPTVQAWVDKYDADYGVAHWWSHQDSGVSDMRVDHPRVSRQALLEHLEDRIGELREHLKWRKGLPNWPKRARVA